MSERLQFPPPPIKSRVSGQDGSFTLQWIAWLGALTNWVQRTRVYSFDLDVPSIPAGGGWWGQFTIPEATLGDFAVASIEPGNRDLAISAAVTAGAQVTVWLRNWGASPIDLAAGTLRVWVQRAR